MHHQLLDELGHLRMLVHLTTELLLFHEVVQMLYLQLQHDLQKPQQVLLALVEQLLASH